MSKNPKNWRKLMKIANIDREFLYIFWTTRENSMTFSGKICFKIILKVTKNQGSTLSIENTFFKKPLEGQFDPPGILGSIKPQIWCKKRGIILFKFWNTLNQFPMKVTILPTNRSIKRFKQTESWVGWGKCKTIRNKNLSVTHEN